MRRIHGLTAYITGGSSGIGYGIAEELLREGARVALIARSEERLRAAEEKLAPLAGADAITHTALDVSDRKAAERALPELVKRFGGPDLLVNSHGTTGVYYFTNTTHDDMMRILDVNIGGPWNTIQILLPELERRGGTIANVASWESWPDIVAVATGRSASRTAEPASVAACCDVSLRDPSSV